MTEEEFGLTPEQIKRLHEKALSQIPMPRKATSEPVIDRSVNRLEKAGYGKELKASNIKPMSWYDKEAGSNVLGTTDFDNNIKINPLSLALYPSIDNEMTLAHELTHVKQNEQIPDKDFRRKLSGYEGMIPYEKRPSEVEAFKAGDDYRDTIPQEERVKQWNIYDDLYKLGLHKAAPQFLPFSAYGKK
jgi:hypothetical protein